MIIDDFLQLQSQQYSSNSQTMQEQSVKISIKVNRKVVGMNFGRFSRTLDGRYKALNPLQPRKGQVPLRTMLNQRFKIYFAASGVILWFLIGILELIWKNYSWMNLRLGKQCMGRSSWFTQGEIQVFQELFRKAYNNDHDQL